MLVPTKASGTLMRSAAGMVLCTDACNSFWEPLTVSSAPKGGPVAGHLGVVERPDGSEQVTFDQKPLYTFDAGGAPVK